MPVQISKAGSIEGRVWSGIGHMLGIGGDASMPRARRLRGSR